MLATVCLLAFCLGASAAAGRPRRLVDKLEVNTSQDYRAVAVKNQAAGEADLRQATMGPPFEEFWAFIPAQKLWVELGCCERRTESGVYVGIESLLLTLMAQHRDLVLYHTHPRTSFIRGNYHENRAVKKVLEEALPSPDDMETMVKLTRRYEDLQPGGNITWRIVSRHGVTTYGLARPDAEVEEDDYRPFAFSPWDDEELTESPPQSARDMRRLIKEALAGLDGVLFSLSFRSLP